MRPSANALLIQAFAVEIKARRIQLGLTQEDLAGLAELDRPYVSMIEVGRKQPSLSVMHRLALALGLSLAVFMRRVERRYQVVQRASEP